VRLQAPYGAFAALSEPTPRTLEALAALCPRDGSLVIIEMQPFAPPPGMRVADAGSVDQMVADALAPGEADVPFTALSNADAAQMLALATLTRPGPFYERTHELGNFIGVSHDGRLAAMAGERLRIPGYTEVSGVCTHPDARGRGYGEALSRIVAERIVARGETPFLHVFSPNASAIRIYEALGFRKRATFQMTVLAWDR